VRDSFGSTWLSSHPQSSLHHVVVNSVRTRVVTVPDILQPVSEKSPRPRSAHSRRGQPRPAAERFERVALPILISLSAIPGILRDLAKISVRADRGHNQLYVCAPELSHCSLH
jgi:hypothetical protein